MVGRTPWSAADAPVGLLAPCKMLISLFRQRDGAVPRGPCDSWEKAFGYGTVLVQLGGPCWI